MKRLLMIFCACAIAVLAMASVSTADGGGKSAAAKRCAAEKKVGKDPFRALYGKHAMRDCIKGEAGTPTVAEFKNAAKACKGERDLDAAAFHANYGSESSKGRNALGKCISQAVKKDDEGEDTPDEGEDPPEDGDEV